MAEEKPKRLNFVYRKANNFSTKYVTGVFGGIGPKGMVIADFFDEKFFIPDLESYVLKEDSSIDFTTGERTIAEGVLREVQVELVMDYNFAVVLRNWLSDRIKEYEVKHPTLRQ